MERRKTMKLYYSPLSVYSAKPRIAMFEKAIAHETKLVNWTPATGWIKPEELPRLNPKAQIPVLVDGETVIYDSTIILEYLDERVPKTPLFPTGVAERARCRILEDLGDTLLAPNLGVLVREVLLKPDQSTRDREGVAQTKAELARQYQRLDRELGRREYLCGEFSVADISCFSPINIASLMEGAPPPELANVTSWLTRMRNRPGVARYLAEFSEATAPLRASTAPAASAQA
jgi:glutathione S-transferase